MFKKSLFGVSLFTMACLYGMLFAVVFLVCLMSGFGMSIVLIASIAIVIIQFLISPFLTDLSMRWFYKANFDHEIPEYLKKFIEEVCNEKQMKYPRMGFIDDGAPNAFTYGHTKNDARIVLTRGIFDLLTEEEVKAVVAHELGHAVHYDMLFMTAAELVPLILYYIYDTFTCIESKSNNDNASKLQAIGYVAFILYIISQYIILWLSRVREYYADSFSVEITKNPNALAEALVKVGYGLTTKTTKNAKMSASKSNTLGIFDAKTSKSLIVSSYDDGEVSKDNIKKAMRWEMWNVWAKLYELKSTHPLISKRLIAISDRCGEFNQQPYIKFDEEKPESYVDDFLLELLLVFAPVIIMIVFFVLMVVTASTENNTLTVIAMCLPFVFFASCILKFNRRHKNKGYELRKVSDLLSEVKVSDITAVPAILEGEVIGRGDPGCMFDEDFVIKDDTGIMFVDYKRVLKIMDLVDSLTKTRSLVGKKVKIKGWYRRTLIPSFEILEMEVEGGVNKKFYSTTVKKVLLYICLVCSLILPILCLAV